MQASTIDAPRQFSGDEDEIDLRELLGLLWDKRWLIVVVTLCSGLISVAYALLVTPIYQADAMVQVEPEPSFPGLDSLAAMVSDTAPAADAEIALMKSRMVVGQVVDKLQLDISVAPHRLPVVGNFIARRYQPQSEGAVAEPWLGLSSYDWGGAELEIFQLDVPRQLIGRSLQLEVIGDHRFRLYDDDGRLLVEGRTGRPVSGRGVTIQVATLRANPGTRFDVVRKSRLKAVKKVQAGINAAEQGKDTGIINVRYEDADPDRAANIVDALVQQYVLQNVERASAEAAQRLEFVRSKLPEVRHRAEQAEEALASYQTQASTANMELKTKALLDEIASVEASISKLKLEQAEVQQRYTARHPVYRTMLNQLSSLQEKKEALEQEVSALPETQQQLLRRHLDVEVNRELYIAMLTQAQQLDVARAGTIGSARVIDDAVVDTSRPVKPKRSLIVALGLVLGGFLAVGWVLVRQMFNRGIEDPAAIEQIGLPVYASIPLSAYQRDVIVRRNNKKRRATAGKLHLLAVEEPADLAIEAVRSLRTSLHFAMLEADNNILMISGAGPNAGKSFVSTNLAVVIAQTGQRVLVVDADLRKGSLHHVMGSGTGKNGDNDDNGAHGLSSLLIGKSELDDTIQHTPVEGLDFIARGQVPPNPSELLMHANCTDLLRQMSARYDLVIVDTPPILAVTDAAIIGNQAGTSLLVARFGISQAREIELAKQRFEQNRVHIKGAIFNAIEKRANGYYGYGYYDYSSAGT